MKVALVHDWLTGMRGGEMVLERLCEMFPDAELYTLVHIPGTVSETIENRRIHTSFLQGFPAAASKYRWYLPLMPRAIESFKLEGYGLVISSSHCVAKGIVTGGAPHLCYCHTPMRYAWDMYMHYFNPNRFGPVTLFAIEKIMPHLRDWDRRTAGRVGRYVANSLNVAARIRKWYGAEADVVYPPVDVDFYTPDKDAPREKYLIVSAFAPYKRIDLAVEAFNKIGKPLHIVGSGEDEARLRAMAGPSVTFETRVSGERLRELYRNARALVFPGEEDFGIIPVEAMACGTPVIAYGRGGALETVIPLRDEFSHGAATGVFFDQQKPGALAAAVERFEANEGQFFPKAARHNAEKFAASVFREKMEKEIDGFLAGRG